MFFHADTYRVFFSVPLHVPSSPLTVPLRLVVRLGFVFFSSFYKLTIFCAEYLEGFIPNPPPLLRALYLTIVPLLDNHRFFGALAPAPQGPHRPGWTALSPPDSFLRWYFLFRPNLCSVPFLSVPPPRCPLVCFFVWLFFCPFPNHLFSPLNCTKP